MPDFEVLDAKIASALNRIIHNSHFKRRVSLEEMEAQKEDRFLRGRQIANLIYEYFWVTGANDSVEKYANFLTIVLRNDDIQEFDSKWDGNLLPMTKIPSDDILDGLYKLRIRESEKLKTVLDMYVLEIHQKKAGLEYHRLKTMVKRSIEQNLRIKNCEARNGNYGRNAVVKNQETKQRVQRILGDCWQWEASGQCSKGDTCSFRHISTSVQKMTQPNPSPSSFMQQSERNASRTQSPRGKSPSGRKSRLPWKDHFKGTLHQFILWKVAPSRMLVLQDQERLHTVCCANWCAFFQKNGRFCCVKWCWLCWFRCLVALFGACTHSLQKPRKTCFLKWKRLWARQVSVRVLRLMVRVALFNATTDALFNATPGIWAQIWSDLSQCQMTI